MQLGGGPEKRDPTTPPPHGPRGLTTGLAGLVAVGPLATLPGVPWVAQQPALPAAEPLVAVAAMAGLLRLPGQLRLVTI